MRRITWSALFSFLICVGAGAYLLSFQSESGDSTWFTIMARGIGAYFIGKGVYVGASLQKQAILVAIQEKALEMQTSAHTARSIPPLEPSEPRARVAAR